MKAYMQNHLSNTAYNQATQNAIVYYMSGTAPTTPTEVKAAVDLSSMSDLHSKCVGAALSKVTYSYDNSGIGKIKAEYRNGGYSWLKGGNIKINSTWYALMPDRVYYSDNRRTCLDNMPPAFFSMPINCITNSMYVYNQIGVLLRSSASDVATYSFYVDYILEFDYSVTVEGQRFCNGFTNGMSDYVDYWFRTDLYRWDSISGSWVFVNTATASSYNTVTTSTFTAIASTKFLVRVFPYYARSGYYSNYLCGYALLASSSIVPSVRSLPDITWSVTMPFPNSSNIQGCSVYRMADRYDSSKADDLATFNPRASGWFTVDGSRSQGRSAFTYGNATVNMPAIIDTCGQSSENMLISKSKSLTSKDAPKIICYSYVGGELV